MRRYSTLLLLLFAIFAWAKPATKNEVNQLIEAAHAQLTNQIANQLQLSNRSLPREQIHHFAKIHLRYFVYDLLAANLTGTKTDTFETWQPQARAELLANFLLIRPLKSIALPKNYGYLHQFTPNYWFLGDKTEDYLNERRLAFLVRPAGKMKLLRVQFHANPKTINASGEGDPVQFNEMTAENLVRVLRKNDVNFNNFDSILISGCQAGGCAVGENVAQTFASKTKLPTFASTTDNGITLTIWIGVNENHTLSYHLNLEPSELQPSESGLRPKPWKYFLPKHRRVTKSIRETVEDLNLENADQIIRSSQLRLGVRFKTRVFTPSIALPAPEGSTDSCGFLKRIKQGGFDFPAELFPGLLN